MKENWEEYREKIIGLGDDSFKKSYYPELQKKIAELEESKEKYKALYENAPLAYQSLDIDGNIIDVNPTWLNILGYTKPEVIGQWFGSFLHPDFVQHFKTNFPKFKKQGFIHDVQFRMLKKNGSEIHVSFEGCIGHTPEGNFKQTYCTFKDITNEVKVKQELIDAKEKAEESDRLKSAFLANMSHEIRTPMNGIIGFSEMFLTPNIDEEKRKFYANIVINSSNQLLSIVNDILDISLIESKSIQIIKEEVVINDLLNEIFAFYKPQCDNKGLSLHINKDLNDEHSTVSTDKNRLKQIISNLINNAIKFTQSGYIKFGYTLNNNQLLFYVEDTGIGISSKNLDIIFDRFHQEEKETSKLYGGTGLGLSISKNLIELLEGEIKVESELNKGSKFIFNIPYNNSNKINTINNTKKTTPESHFTILIAEDEEINFLYLIEILSEFDVTIIPAKNGQETIEICKKNKEIDLILMDVKMPVVNGLDATKAIKKFRPDLPIIAQTAYAMTSDKDEVRKAGCDDYISKPIEANDIIKMIKRYINIKHTQ